MLPERERVERMEPTEEARERGPLSALLGGVTGGVPGMHGNMLGSLAGVGGVPGMRGNLAGEGALAGENAPPGAKRSGEGAQTPDMSRETARLTSLGMVAFIASSSSANIAVPPLMSLIALRRSPGKSAMDAWVSPSPRLDWRSSLQFQRATAVFWLGSVSTPATSSLSGMSRRKSRPMRRQGVVNCWASRPALGNLTSNEALLPLMSPRPCRSLAWLQLEARLGEAA